MVGNNNNNNTTTKSHVHIISDTHFHHTNIISYANRPFANTDDMNQTLITNWNNHVQPNDYVLHLGDFVLGQKANIAVIRQQLNGNIILVRGNHDYGANAYRGLERFKYVRNLKFGDIMFTHKPMMVEEMDRLGVVSNFHGHVHGRRVLDNNDRWFNFSVEVIGYKPFYWGEVEMGEFVEVVRGGK